MSSTMSHLNKASLRSTSPKQQQGAKQAMATTNHATSSGNRDAGIYSPAPLSSPTAQQYQTLNRGNFSTSPLTAAGVGMRSDGEAQTELVLYPNHDSVADRYSHIHAESYRQLEQLRLACGNGMTALAGTVYDLIAFKDVMLKLEERLPAAPVTDLLLLTSKLFRETADMSRLLQAFFQNVFSDGYHDDIFHFTDTRLLKQELAEMREAVKRLSAERDEAVAKYKDLSRGLHQHAVVVKALEDRNDALELRSSALEDQMALLFSQLADDFLFYNEELLEKTTEKMAQQQPLVPARSAFSQSVETINKRLVNFQNTLNEIYNDAKISAISESSGGTGGSVKSKLKQLDQSAQQMIQRFSAVKEGLMATSEELVTALKDKKRIINFSLQHIKLFDVQSTKLRASRALMHEIRQRVTALERTLAQTLLNGMPMKIDRNGDIVYTHGTGGGGGTASTALVVFNGVDDNNNGSDALLSSPQQQHPPHTLRNVKAFQSQLLELQDAVQKVSSAMDTTNEQKALLKAVSMAASPSTGKAYGQQGVGSRDNGGGGGGAASSRNGMNKDVFLPSRQIASAVVGGGRGGTARNNNSLSNNNNPSDAAALLTSLQSQFGRVNALNPPTHSNSNSNNNSFSNNNLRHNSNTSQRSASVGGGGNNNANNNGGPSSIPSSVVIMLRQLKNDYANKLDFIRSVYEGQLGEYEDRIDQLNSVVRKQQLQINSLFAGSNNAVGKIEASLAGGGSSVNNSNAPTVAPQPRSQQLNPAQSLANPDSQVPDKDAALASKERWAATRKGGFANTDAVIDAISSSGFAASASGNNKGRNPPIPEENGYEDEKAAIIMRNRIAEVAKASSVGEAKNLIAALLEGAQHPSAAFLQQQDDGATTMAPLPPRIQPTATLSFATTSPYFHSAAPTTTTASRSGNRNTSIAAASNNPSSTLLKQGPSKDTPPSAMSLVHQRRSSSSRSSVDVGSGGGDDWGGENSGGNSPLVTRARGATCGPAATDNDRYGHNDENAGSVRNRQPPNPLSLDAIERDVAMRGGDDREDPRLAFAQQQHNENVSVLDELRRRGDL